MDTQTTDSLVDSEVLRAEKIGAAYGHKVALSEVDFSMAAGRVTGLVGDNGAGKSTLLKILAGVQKPTQGKLSFRGHPMEFGQVREARAAGIEAVHQDLGLCANLSIYQNVFLGREMQVGWGPFQLLARKQMRRRAHDILTDSLGIDVGDVRNKASALSGGQQQLVALGRAEAWECKALLLDEPTAALSTRATERVNDVIRQMTLRGVSVLIISHNLPQLLEIADDIAVLRLGRSVGKIESQRTDAKQLVGLMTGALTINDGGVCDAN